jgi:hypothetical protein
MIEPFLVGTALHLVVPAMVDAARSGMHTGHKSVNRSANVHRSANLNRHVNLRNTARTSLNRNVNVPRSINVTINRNVNIDVDQHWHPVATAAAVTATAAVTALSSGWSVIGCTVGCCYGH